MLEDRPDRVFYDDVGNLYKAKDPAQASHAEVNFPSEDMLKALLEVPCTREVMLSRINHPNFRQES
jgi:hypothetical protein